MNELIEKWRKQCGNRRTSINALKMDCADEAEAWRDSLWTTITDDPESWPKEEPYAVFSLEGHYIASGYWPPKGLVGFSWRPLIP